jgi:hypothetical protein
VTNSDSSRYRKLYSKNLFHRTFTGKSKDEKLFAESGMFEYSQSSQGYEA